MDFLTFGVICAMTGRGLEDVVHARLVHRETDHCAGIGVDVVEQRPNRG